MDYIIDGLIEALKLIISFDEEIYSIVLLTLFISFFSTLLSSLIGIPFGLFTGLKKFRGKRIYSKILYTFMGLPPVIVGLFVSIIISRRGPFGTLDLMYTTTAMIIAQTILVVPIITGIIFNNVKGIGNEIKEICVTLGGERRHLLIMLIKEMRYNILIAITTGFGRAISEVGAMMIVGGNIKGHTRTMTTFIAMNNSMGNYSTSIAMGIILLTISFIVNSFLYKYSIGGNNGYNNN